METKCLVSRDVNFELKYVKTDISVSRQNKQKFIQSQSRSHSLSRSESHSRGPRPRRLTKILLNFKINNIYSYQTQSPYPRSVKQGGEYHFSVFPGIHYPYVH